MVNEEIIDAMVRMAKDSMRSDQVPELFYQVRKRVGDIRAQLPAEVIGPFFNDEFGDTFGNIYALSGEGFDYALKRDTADRIHKVDETIEPDLQIAVELYAGRLLDGLLE